jgi:hypothetical protein
MNDFLNSEPFPLNIKLNINSNSILNTRNSNPPGPSQIRIEKPVIRVSPETIRVSQLRHLFNIEIKKRISVENLYLQFRI